MKKTLSLALSFAIVLSSAAFVFSKEPVDPIKPKSLEGRTWTISAWDVPSKQGPLKFELSLVVDKITGTGKKTSLHGVYISQESRERKPDISDFESPLTITKDGFKFVFKTSQGDTIDAQVLSSDGSCRLQGPLGVATLKPASR